MICRCQPPVECGRRTSHSIKNPNREFFTCVNPAGDCGFFQWVDAPVGGARRVNPPPAYLPSMGKTRIELTVAEFVFEEDSDNDNVSAPKIWINILVRVYTLLLQPTLTNQPTVLLLCNLCIWRRPRTMRKLENFSRRLDAATMKKENCGASNFPFTMML